MFINHSIRALDFVISNATYSIPLHSSYSVLPLVVVLAQILFVQLVKRKNVECELLELTVQSSSQSKALAYLCHVVSMCLHNAFRCK